MALPNHFKNSGSSSAFYLFETEFIQIVMIVFVLSAFVAFTLDTFHNLIKFSVVDIVVNIINPCIAFFSLTKSHSCYGFISGMEGNVFTLEISVFNTFAWLICLYEARLTHFFIFFCELVEAFYLGRMFRILSASIYNLPLNQEVLVFYRGS